MRTVEPVLPGSRVAIVHDWLVKYAGAERVVEQLLHLFPHADLYTLVDFLPPHERHFLRGREVRTSVVQRFPMARRLYRHYLPFLMVAVEQFDLSGYDVVISSSHAVAKGVLTGPDQLHVCYCHSPIRYAWDLQHEYLRETGLDRGILSPAVRWLLHKVRVWDLRTANAVDAFIANSRFIQRRIAKVYRRRSSVIYPPVDVESFGVGTERGDFYLAASRMVPYKRMAMIVEAFSRMPSRRLVVIGDGPEFRRVKQVAGPNVQVLGYQPTEVLRDYMSRARAFVFAAEEDFGIILVEAQACGTPVIAYGRGGAAETVVDGVTGVLYPRQTPEEVVRAVERFESIENDFDRLRIRGHAERFGIERFRSEFSTTVERLWDEFRRTGMLSGNDVK